MELRNNAGGHVSIVKKKKTLEKKNDVEVKISNSMGDEKNGVVGSSGDRHIAMYSCNFIII